MRVLWVGDSPTVATGFAACTRAACHELDRRGHEVHVLGINEYGGPHAYPYTIYPCYHPFDHGHDALGVERLPYLVERVRPDLVVILNDPWNVPHYLDSLDSFLPSTVPCPPVVGWLAVDACNQRGEPLNRLAHVAVWTQFAADELARGGYDGESTVIPLGVDTSLFKPMDRATSRLASCPPTLPPDTFLVGAVGRNQPRKRLDLTIAYFAEWVHARHRDNAQLYLHVAPTGERGADIPSLVHYHGLDGRVILATPHIGYGIQNTDMPYIYSALDVYLSTSQGEGWGLPCLEAMACGVPCVVPNWSGLGRDGWPGDAVVRVPCTSTALSAPLNAHPYTIGGVPDRAETIKALDDLYRAPLHRSAYVARGLKKAAELTWWQTGQEMSNLLESLLSKAAQVQADTRDEPAAVAAQV